MNAFIYAAGRASRLGAISKGRHKMLLPFGGKSLLEWHAIRLRESGVSKIFVITGHLREQLVEEMSLITRRHGIPCEEIFNPDFQEGSILSMAVSIPKLESIHPFVLLLDGDVLYDTRMLRRLIDSKHPSVLLIDRGYSCADDDPVLVPILNGRPVDFVKRWRGDSDEIGESIGFFKLDAQDIPILAKETRARQTGAGRMDSYDDALRAMVKSGVFMHEDVTGIPWTEIDFPEDIDFALNTVLPKLLPPNAG
ncbi:MAG: phosphocholine cytidylyltransferase family protein [Verrucomicrobia bacterium]|nr:phosphocholine cytidylyltransferase family protein [Verrucomicrobiota bacterium]